MNLVPDLGRFPKTKMSRSEWSDPRHYTYERVHIVPRGGPGSTRAEASCSHEADRMAGRFPQVAASWPRRRTAARTHSGREGGSAADTNGGYP